MIDKKYVIANETRNGLRILPGRCGQGAGPLTHEEAVKSLRFYRGQLKNPAALIYEVEFRSVPEGEVSSTCQENL